MPICIAGHVGIGHVFSHSGFVQDDSQGFSLIANLLAHEHRLDMHVSSVNTISRDGYVQINVRSGGRGIARPRRGVTPFETILMENLVGADALYPQRAVLNVLGRMYGNGILEVPTSLEYALAEAVMESFSENISGFVIEREGHNGDIYGGVPGEIGGIPVTFLLTVNGSGSGVGANEDHAGNIPLGARRKIMEKLGVVDVPTIIIESKAYNPANIKLRENSFMVSYNRDIDNEIVGRCLIEAIKKDSLPYQCDDEAFPFNPGTMRRQTENAGATLVQLGEDLSRCNEAAEKVEITAEIARFVTEDLGGVIFMSDRIHDYARSAGAMPGTAAVLSRIVTSDYIKRYRIPFVTDKDVLLLKKVLESAVPLLFKDLDKAQTLLREKKNFFKKQADRTGNT